MTVHSHRRRLRIRVQRIAFAIAAILHVAAVCLAPIAEAANDRIPAAHVEEAGTSLHHAHIEATCFACNAHLLLVPPPAPVNWLQQRGEHRPVAARTAPDASPERFLPLGSRAPPIVG